MPNNQTFEDEDLQHIYQKMLEWLSIGAVSEQRLVDRIVRLRRLYPETYRYRNYTRENAGAVTKYLKQQGLVDDRRLAERLFELLKDKKDGLRAIRRKMLARKLPVKIVDAVLKEFTEQGIMQDHEKILAAVRLKHARLKEKYGADPKKKYQIRPKLYAWLAMRGYNPDESSEILKKAQK